MEAVTLDTCASVHEMASLAYTANDPVSIIDSDSNSECLVVMTPSVFERILFDSGLVNCLACQERRASASDS